MKRFTLFSLTILVALSLALGLPAAARPDEDVRPEDNFAIAINTHDDSLRFKRAFEVIFTSNDIIDNGNAAVAYASCERCRTIAIAVQAVIVSGSPSQLTPENVALAINDACTQCETLASAYQFVVGGGDPLRLTPAGRHRINAIKHEIRGLGRSGLPLTEIQARLDVLMTTSRSFWRPSSFRTGRTRTTTATTETTGSDRWRTRSVRRRSPRRSRRRPPSAGRRPLQPTPRSRSSGLGFAGVRRHGGPREIHAAQLGVIRMWVTLLGRRR
jgi:hypothetical protein